MQRSLHLSLSLSGFAALALANTPLLPAAAQDSGTAEDLGGVMSISLKDVVKPTFGFQGALPRQLKGRFEAFVAIRAGANDIGSLLGESLHLIVEFMQKLPLT